MSRNRRTNRASNLGRLRVRGAHAGLCYRWSDDAPRCEADPVLPKSPGRIRSVLVPLDGTAVGESALPLAADIARRAGAELQIVHVYSPPGVDEPPVRYYYTDDRSRPQDARCGQSRGCRQAYMNEVADALTRATGKTVKSQLLESRNVVAALHTAAADADLVVMATHGRGPLGRLWHGSVVRDLARRVGPPLLVVPGGGNAPAQGAVPTIRRVLMPLDGTADAERVLGPAATLGQLLGADFTLMRAVPLQHLHRPEPAGHAAGRLPWTSDAPRLRAIDALARGADRLAAQGFAVETQVVFDERPVACAVLEAARHGSADLIALTVGRRGALARFLFGSTAESVIRSATIPVLIARPRGD